MFYKLVKQEGFELREINACMMSSTIQWKSSDDTLNEVEELTKGKKKVITGKKLRELEPKKRILGVIATKKY